MSFFLETPRLRIRPWQPASDEPAFARLATDPEVMRYIGDGQLWNREQRQGFFARQQSHLDEHGICLGALEVKPDNEAAGLAGLQPLGTSGEIEVGWWLQQRYWGQGLATEAGRASARHAFEVLGLERLYAIALPENRASTRIMEKLGMSYQGLRTSQDLGLRVGGLTLATYVLESRDWEGKSAQP